MLHQYVDHCCRSWAYGPTAAALGLVVLPDGFHGVRRVPAVTLGA